MKPGKLRRALVGTGIVVVLAMLAILLLMRSGPDDSLPNPNGYDDFVKAGQFVSEQVSQWDKLTLPELRALVETNREALRLLRVGLTKECKVPPYKWTNTFNHSEELNGLKGLAWAIRADIRLALLDGHTNAAANACLDCIRLGSACTRSGVVLDGLIGIAVQTIGVSLLEPLLQSVDAATAREVAAKLEDAISKREPSDAAWKREWSWSLKGRFGLTGAIYPIVHYSEVRKTKLAFQQKDQQIDGRLGKAALDFAARAYELENGTRPSSTRDLVPQYLKANPKDPATGTDLPLSSPYTTNPGGPSSIHPP